MGIEVSEVGVVVVPGEFRIVDVSDVGIVGMEVIELGVGVVVVGVEVIKIGLPLIGGLYSVER
ncbi:Hypothetical predicted protein [Prunus dulcis]|uniref:Uncharacterized protein n=1 Tax=Prunus dulcis TaxID=3755 RepID=A0A5E4G680_PRUDU|nr:Hypothetical predicted protein [Prunus dulcis]